MSTVILVLVVIAVGVISIEKIKGDIRKDIKEFGEAVDRKIKELK